MIGFLSGLFSSSKRAKQRRGNQEVCQNLESHGDELTAPRQIDHWIYFQTSSNRTTFIEEAQKLGFDVGGYLEDQSDSMPYGVRVTRIDVPSYDAIDDVTLPLFDLAQSLDGNYDGWETSVVNGTAAE